MIEYPYEDTKTFFHATVPVLVTHLNYGNHLGYDSLLTIIQDARIIWLKQYGMWEGCLDDKGSIGFVVKEVSVDYKAEAHHGDMLQIEFYISHVTKTSFYMHYKVTRFPTKEIVALAETKHVIYDYELKKVVKMPEKFINTISSSEKSCK